MAPLGLGQQRLINIQPPAAKLIGGTGQIQAENAETERIGLALDFTLRCLETMEPMLKRHPIVLAQAFDIARLETGCSSAPESAPDCSQEMTGKNITVHERAAGPILDVRCAHNHVMEELPAGTKQLIGAGKVVIEAFFRYVFGRAYAGDPVEKFTRTELKKVFNFHAAPIGQPRAADALPGDCRLMRAERKTESLHAVVRRRMYDQRAPATSQIEQALPRLETQLAADLVELTLLRFSKGGLRRLKVGAAIRQRFVQP